MAGGIACVALHSPYQSSFDASLCNAHCLAFALAHGRQAIRSFRDEDPPNQLPDETQSVDRHAHLRGARTEYGMLYPEMPFSDAQHIARPLLSRDCWTGETVAPRL